MHHPVPGSACGEAGYGLGETRKLDDRFWGVLVRQCEKKKEGAHASRAGGGPCSSPLRFSAASQPKGARGRLFFGAHHPRSNHLTLTLPAVLGQAAWATQALSSSPARISSVLSVTSAPLTSTPHSHSQLVRTRTYSPKSSTLQPSGNKQSAPDHWPSPQVAAHLHHCVIAPIS